MDHDELSVLLAHLRTRPRMWLPSEHYAALVSFLVGLDEASGRSLLSGFADWLGSGSLTWWGHVERAALARGDCDVVSDMTSRLSDADSDRCVTALFASLDGYLASTKPTP